MDTKLIVLCVLTLVLTFLVIKKSEYLTSATNILSVDSLSNVIPFSNTAYATYGIFAYYEALLNELSKNPIYGSINSFFRISGPTGSEYPGYMTDAQLEQMFETAYTQGESSLPERDRVLLRELAFYSSWSLSAFGSRGDIPYTSDGVPTFASQIINDSGKPVKEFLFNAILSTADSINNILPSRFPKYNSGDTVLVNDTNQERAAWVAQAVMIPHAWIAWLAKNKWNLNMTWKSPYCSGGVVPTPSRIISRPSGTSYGPGTYTLAQLGNPTSIELYAPIQVNITRSTGASRDITLTMRMECIYSAPDDVIDNTSTITSLVVSVPT